MKNNCVGVHVRVCVCCGAVYLRGCQVPADGETENPRPCPR